MKNISIRLFELTLLVFAISVTVTMYNMAVAEDETQLWGLNYSYYMLPLLAVNIGICIKHMEYIRLDGLTRLMILWGVIVTINAIFISSKLIITLIRVNLWITTFLAACCLSRSNKMGTDNLTITFFLVFILGFVVYWQGKIEQFNDNYNFEARSNAIYCIVTIVPILMLMKKKWLVLIIMMLTFVSTIYSNKRGATIILLLTMIPIMRDTFSVIRSKTWRNLLFIVTIGFTLFFLLYLSNSILGGVLVERFSTIEETGGSNRRDIWNTVLYAYKNSDISQQIFGHGYYAVSTIVEQTAAHNDFIEVLYDYGIIGFIVYLAMHIYMIRKIFELRVIKNETYLPYLTMYLTFFAMSMVSILIVQQRYLIYMAAFWGFLEGCDYDTTLEDEDEDEDEDGEGDEDEEKDEDEENNVLIMEARGCL